MKKKLCILLSALICLQFLPLFARADFVCPKCNGAQTIEYTGVCIVCNGDLSVPRLTSCAACSGTGKVKQNYDEICWRCLGNPAKHRIDPNCVQCGGTGRSRGSMGVKCTVCAGRGYSEEYVRCTSCEGGYMDHVVIDCPICSGAGWVDAVAMVVYETPGATFVSADLIRPGYDSVTWINSKGPEKKGFVFRGWTTDPCGEEISVYGGETVSVEDILDISGGSAVLALYPSWTVACLACEGTGRQKAPCDVCGGDGVKKGWPCTRCGGKGYSLTDEACPYCRKGLLEGTAAHSEAELRITAPATCGSEGSAQCVCPACGAADVFTIPKTDHRYGDGKSLGEKEHIFTCETDPRHTKTAPHVWQLDREEAATCQKEGTRYYVCRDCEAKREEAFEPKIPHAFGPWERLDFEQHVRWCNNIPYHAEQAPHVWDKGRITRQPSCADWGEKTYECTLCGATKTESIDALAHIRVTDPAVAPTCTEAGKTEGSHCASCGKTLTYSYFVEATGHRWDGGKETLPATCEEKGTTTFTCTVCGETRTEEIPALGHDPVTDPAVEPTCTADGKTEGSHCARCGAILTAQIACQELGHNYAWKSLDETRHRGVCMNDPAHVVTGAHVWDEGVVTKKPTDALPGERMFICIVCSEMKTQPIPPTAGQGFRCGDVNGDGEVGADDARLALRRSVDLETLDERQTRAADVDHDGMVSAADARLILRCSVGLEDLNG